MKSVNAVLKNAEADRRAALRSTAAWRFHVGDRPPPYGRVRPRWRQQLKKYEAKPKAEFQ